MRGILAGYLSVALVSVFYPAVSFAGKPVSSIIIGGAEVQSSDPIAKNTVGVRISGGTCSGSILDNDLVVTAAHCLPEWGNEAVEVVFALRMDDRQAEARTVKAYLAHPHYTFQTGIKNRNDVALLYFEGGLPSGYRASNLIPESMELQAGQDVWLAGYGVTDGFFARGDGTLRKVQVTLRDVDYSDTEVTTEQKYGRGACFGDSGGPAFLKRNGKYYLFGVTNWGPDYCDDYGVYANLKAYREWLEETATELRKQGSR